MRKTILAFVLLLSATFTYAQDEDAANKLVSEGVAYNDKGDYDGALKRYDRALEKDKDNIMALAEKAYTLLATGKYDEVLIYCRRAIETHPGSSKLKTVFVTYGNAYDELKKTDSSIVVYDEGIRMFPADYMLYFNKGITLSSVKRYDEALLCFQKSMELNPKHPGSQHATGILLKEQEKHIPALLALCRFMVLSPTGDRAKVDLVNIQELMNGSAEKTGKKSITIHVSPDMLKDTAVNGVYKENSFVTTDLILAMSAGLDFDKKYKNEIGAEKFARKFTTVCSSLSETKDKNHGFYWSYYVPYFTDMHDKGFIETFSYLVYASSDDAVVQKWLKSHKEEINKFYTWSKAYEWEGSK